jgi:hypothetical protein
MTISSCVVVDSPTSRFSEQKVTGFNDFELFSKNAFLFDTVEVVSAVGMHAVRPNITQTIRAYLFVVMNENP